MGVALKLISENPNLFDDFEIIEEQTNLKGPANMFISGKFIGCDMKNRNGRWYDKNDTRADIDRYIKEMVEPGRAMGELGHPLSPEVNLERSCHLVTILKETNEGYDGKAKILTTPLGMLLRSLINDGVKVGVSTRALGSIHEDSQRGNVVKDMHLVAIDAVADPSYPKAFVDGILESASWTRNANGHFDEVYSNFEKSISKLPRKQLDVYLRDQITKFISNLSK